MKARKTHSATMRHRLFSLVLFICCALPGAAYSITAAMVIDLQGKATITNAGNSRDATILADLETDARVQLDSGATLVALYLDSGNEYVFKGPAVIVFALTQPDVISGSRPEKRSSSLGGGIRIKPAGLAQGAIVLRSFSTNARIRLLSLSSTLVLETRPEFLWQELQPGIRYSIEIADDTGRLLYEAQVEATSFKFPAGLQLKEGSSYTWEVSARLPNGRKYSSVGDFHVASSDLRAQAAALRAEPSAPVSSRVTYAAWLDQVELKDEARKYWRALSAERPEDKRLRMLSDQ